MVILLGACSYTFYRLGAPEMAWLCGIPCGLTMLALAMAILLGVPLPPSLTGYEKSDIWLAQKYGPRSSKSGRTRSGHPIGED